MWKFIIIDKILNIFPNSTTITFDAGRSYGVNNKISSLFITELISSLDKVKNNKLMIEIKIIIF